MRKEFFPSRVGHPTFNRLVEMGHHGEGIVFLLHEHPIAIGQGYRLSAKSIRLLLFLAWCGLRSRHCQRLAHRWPLQQDF